MKTVIFVLISLTAAYVIGVLLYASATKYKPIDVTHLDRYKSLPPFMIQDTSYSILTWNIGYGGLGKESDFFYDGGEMVITPEPTFSKNLNGIKDLLKSTNSDFICLQEVDTSSKRSHRVNELELISNELGGYEYSFAKNYDVRFVPRPFLNPLGKVTSGLAIFSKLPGTYFERISYKSEGGFPRNLFMLKRCFSKTHIPLSKGKDLVIINIHNSAYDPGGKFKKSELDILFPYIADLYNQGHYVVVGGDWNQCPPGYVTKGKNFEYGETFISSDLINNGWKWASDNHTPTNRKLDQKYDSESSYTSVIDFFLTSPNVTIDRVETIDTQFEFSDHQPVKMNFTVN